MKLKLFGAKRRDGFCGGLIVVAAHDIAEAYNVYVKWALDEEKYILYTSRTYADGYVDVDDKYPIREWYMIEGVEVVCDAPRVIDEDGYTE